MDVLVDQPVLLFVCSYRSTQFVNYLQRQLGGFHTRLDVGR